MPMPVRSRRTLWSRCTERIILRLLPRESRLMQTRMIGPQPASHPGATLRPDARINETGLTRSIPSQGETGHEMHLGPLHGAATARRFTRFWSIWTQNRAGERPT